MGPILPAYHRGMVTALFVSHGSPMIALDEQGDFARALRAFGDANRPRRAVVVVSAHWWTRDLRVTASPRLLDDFGGFPDELYRIEYPCRGDAALAAEIAALTGARAEERGLDHGAWIPLRFIFPRADVPVVQVSLPRQDRHALRALGEKLASIDGTLLVASGGIVHNLRLVHFEDEHAPAGAWARAFDDWVYENAGPDLDPMLGPFHELAVPTPEHFDPLHVVLGERGELVHASMLYGNLSMRTFTTRIAAGTR